MGHFLITTRGRTGSFWLANAFDMHPEIICSHGRGRACASWIFCEGANMYFDKRCLKGMQWRNRELPEEVAKMLSKFTDYEGDWGRSDKFPKTIDGFLQEQETIGQAKYYGNVNAFQLRELLHKNSQQTPKKPFKIANNIRHPVTLVQSAVTDFVMFRNNPQVRENYYKKYNQTVKSYNLEVSDDVVAFFREVDILDTYLETLEFSSLLQIPMEKVTMDRDFFCHILKSLTDKNIEITSDYLSSVFDNGRLNDHAGKKRKKLTPEQIFDSWLPWQQDYFRKKLMQFENIWPRMYELGYNLDHYIKSNRISMRKISESQNNKHDKQCLTNRQNLPVNV